MNNRYKKQRYFTGTKSIDVPDTMSNQDVMTGTTNSAMAGAQAGSAFGPWGMAIGGAIGAGKGYMQGRSAQAESIRQADIAKRTNAQYSALGIGDTQLDLGVQPYQARNGYTYETGSASTPSKEIEIEKNEIVTDGDYNIKAIGETPHSQGGDDIVVNKGDTVFPTQNPKDFKSILAKIKEYKNGVKSAKAELDAEKNKLPKDTNIAVDGYDGGFSRPMYDDAFTEFGNLYSGQGTNEQWSSFIDDKGFNPVDVVKYQQSLGGDVGTIKSNRPDGPMSTAYANSYYSTPNSIPETQGLTSGRTASTFNNPDEGSFMRVVGSEGESPKGYRTLNSDRELRQPRLRGVDEEQEVDTSVEQRSSIYDNLDTGRKIDPMKYANVAYNLAKSQEPVDTYKPIKPTYQKYQTVDTRPEDRRAAIEAQKIRESNIEETGGSRGQIQSYLGQSTARYTNDIANANRRYIEQAQGVANQNVDLENRARMMEYQDTLGARAYRQKGEGVRQDFQSEVPREIAERAQLNEQAEYMRQRNQNQYKMDELRLRYGGTDQYVFDPYTGEPIHISKANRG